MILTILYKLDGCVKPSNIDIQLSNNSAVPSTVTNCACCNTKDRGFICSEIYIYFFVDERVCHLPSTRISVAFTHSLSFLSSRPSDCGCVVYCDDVTVLHVNVKGIIGSL